ncbi:MAG: 50S ribosomal protein L9 [Patescibacteria group bacterium]
MKVIFLESIAGTATKGEVKNVKNGYFRNFLLPRKKAVMGTAPALKKWESLRKNMLIEKEQLVGQFQEIKRRLEGAKLKIEKKVTAKGTLYGGVKATDIVKAIKQQFNVEVEAKSVIIPAAIKAVGSHTVRIQLAEGISTMVTAEVVEKK